MLGGIQLDARLIEAHSNTTTITKNPVESGPEINDHAIVEPRRLHIVAQVSDNPLGGAAFSQLRDSVTGLFGSSTNENLTRSQVAYEAILQLQRDHVIIAVQTGLVRYENMIITALSIDQDKDTSRIALMRVVLDEILITESMTTSLNDEQVALLSRPLASPTEELGRQESVAPSQPQNASLLRLVTRVLGVLR